MIPVVSFIGWKNSGKTTLAQQVVASLKEKGYRVGVVKSTHHTAVDFDRENSDTRQYCNASADVVALLAPDQMVSFTSRPDMKLIDLVNRYFHDVDIVVGEGFKNERHIAKIEVTGGEGELLRDQVTGVVALVTERTFPDGTRTFRPDQIQEISGWIIEQFVEQESDHDIDAVLFVNGKKVPMKGFVRDALAKTVVGFVSSLKRTTNPESMEIRIKVKNAADRA